MMKKRLPIMLAVGLVLIITGVMMINSDMEKDLINIIITALVLLTGIGLVIFSGKLSLRKFINYMKRG